MKLRPYQEKNLDEILTAYEEGKKSLLYIAGTGTGKTIVAAHLIKCFYEAGVPVMFQITLDTLCHQTVSTFKAVGIPEEDIGIIRGGAAENRMAPVQVASQQALTRPKRDWWKRRGFGLFVLDEAHASGFSACAAKTREVGVDARFLYVTASPWRLSRRQGFDFVDDQVNAPSFLELQQMNNGYVVPRIDYFSLPQKIDLTGVRTVAGEFAQAELSNKCGKPEVINAMVREWKRRASGLRTLVFCVDVANAEANAAALNEAGVPAAVVTGSTPREERERLYQKLHDKEIMVLCSCMALSTGFDLPSAECGVLMRPSKSQALHIQQIGRLARPYDGKERALILDMAGNCTRFPYSLLEDIPGDLRRQMPGEPGPGGGGNSTKECPDCLAILRNFETECPHCGHDFQKDIKPHTGPLVALKRKADQKGKEPPESRLKAQYQKLRKQAYSRGLLPGWAWHRYKENVGSEPKSEWTLHSIFRTVDVASVNNYFVYLETMADRRGLADREGFISAEMAREFGRGVDWQALLD